MNPMELRSSHHSAAQLESVVQFLETNPTLPRPSPRIPARDSLGLVKFKVGGDSEEVKQFRRHHIKTSKKCVKHYAVQDEAGYCMLPLHLKSYTEKFLRLKEQRLDLDLRLVAVLEQGAERERLTAQAHIVLGDGLKALAEAINSRS